MSLDVKQDKSTFCICILSHLCVLKILVTYWLVWDLKSCKNDETFNIAFQNQNLVISCSGGHSILKSYNICWWFGYKTDGLKVGINQEMITELMELCENMFSLGVLFCPSKHLFKISTNCSSKHRISFN